MKVTNVSSPPNLPEIIKNLEELVLASSGVEPFEEILKLIYIKLYAERNGHSQLSHKSLFAKAKKEWPGIFDQKDKIELSPAHLKLCILELEKIKLNNSDLSIIDPAFEYIVPKAFKGSRGQYFTPRHIISEIVKILDPKNTEYILDPACGSGGFLIRAAEFASNGKPAQNIYGIDYDLRMTRIAKAMFLIAGFNNANILTANTLGHITNLKNNNFDVILTNPPFGGEIKDYEILRRFELVVDNRGNIRNCVERHILFIEKIIHLLKPGGRAAVIVPQSILNNTNLSYIREWLYAHARIIGVIGLDTNTFKPHTNVKTSIIFLQKWKGKPLSDYPLFLAVSSKSGKNLSGEIMYKLVKGKYIIDTDIPEITQKFREFLKNEKINF